MKNKKILSIILSVLAVIITITVLVILYLKTDIFRTNQELFAKYFAQNGTLFEILKNTQSDAQDEFKAYNTYTTVGELSAAVQNGTNIQEIKATTNSRHDATTNRTYGELNLKNGENDLLKVSYINCDDIYSLKCDEVVANYIGIRNSDLQAFAQKMGIKEEDISKIPNQIDFAALKDIPTLTEEQRQHLIDVYLKVILETVTRYDVTRTGKTEIEIDGTSYSANGYELNMDAEMLKEIKVNCLTKLQSDNTTLVMISNKLSALGIYKEYTDITKLSQVIADYTSKIQSGEIASEDIMKIAVYEKDGETIRTIVSINNGSGLIIDRFDTGNNKKVTMSIDGELIAYKIILEKTETTENTENAITFETYSNEKALKQSIKLKQKVWNMQEASDTTKEVSIENSTSIEGINAEGIDAGTTSIVYKEKMQPADQVEEIMELKGSNSVIVNNYTKEQLVPYLNMVSNKAKQILTSKMEQLGVAL